VEHTTFISQVPMNQPLSFPHKLPHSVTQSLNHTFTQSPTRSPLSLTHSRCQITLPPHSSDNFTRSYFYPRLPNNPHILFSHACHDAFLTPFSAAPAAQTPSPKHTAPLPESPNRNPAEDVHLTQYTTTRW